VHVVVPYAPGGSTDTVARIVADRLSSIWGQQLVIENRPGAGTNIGAAAVANSDPDGYTIIRRLIVACDQPSSLSLAALCHERSCTGDALVHVSSVDGGA
jgi:tripartite-type tricarboxylate transporter receptor subunit TctC